MRWFLTVLIICALGVLVTRWTIELGLGMVNETNASIEHERRKTAEVQARYEETGLLLGPDQAQQPYRPLPQYHPFDPAPETAPAAVAPEPRAVPEPAPEPQPQATPPALAPRTPEPAPRAPAKPYTGPTFTVGSTMAEVEAIQGHPSGRLDLPRNRQYRWWGSAVVQFHGGVVESWQDADGVLHVRPPAAQRRVD